MRLFFERPLREAYCWGQTPADRQKGTTVAGYAVVDVETTGLFPGRHDRVIEIAIVHVSPDGDIEDSWGTLVNPNRDLGLQALHGIVAADLLYAPSFDRIAGELATRLAGRAFVAHNASFDQRFVCAEFGRSGWEVPLLEESLICTMEWAGRLLPGAPRSLRGCCEFVGIPVDRAHAALADAMATAEILRLCLRGSRGAQPWADALAHAATVRWPDIPVHEVVPAGRGAAEAASVPYLERLTDRLPRTPASREQERYLAMLDQALLDRVLSVREKDALVAIAAELGIDRAAALGLHRGYLRALARVARADGIVTEAERADLERVAELLELDRREVQQALDEAACAESAREMGSPRFALAPGDLVVLTGEMELSREEWIRRATDAGLRVHPNVTKKVNLVVAADPDSLSGKARKAADYGIPIVTETAFERMLLELA